MIEFTLLMIVISLFFGILTIRSFSDRLELFRRALSELVTHLHTANPEVPQTVIRDPAHNPIDFPHIREYAQCPICSVEKDHGLVVCWKCYNSLGFRYGITLRVLLLLEGCEAELARRA
jgi:hypothetical protein